MQDACNGGFHCAVLTQIRFDHALRRQLFISVAGDRHRYAIAGLGVTQMVAVDGNLGVFLGDRLHKIGVSALHQCAGQLVVGAAQYANDRTLASPTIVFALGQLDQHAVAMPRAAVSTGRDKQVVRLGAIRGRVRGDKSEGAFGGKIGACHTAVMRADGKTVFLVFHHLTVRNQMVERVL